MSGLARTEQETARRHVVDLALAERLAAIVGEKRVLSRGGELLAYSSDGLPGYFKEPSIAVFPGTRDEVVAVVRAGAESLP